MLNERNAGYVNLDGVAGNSPERKGSSARSQASGRLVAKSIAPDGIEIDCGGLAVDILTASSVQHRNKPKGFHDRTLSVV